MKECYEIKCRTSLNTQQTETGRDDVISAADAVSSWLQPIRAAADRQVTRLWIQQLQRETHRC